MTVPLLYLPGRHRTVWFAYSEDRKGEHPRQHLKNFKGVGFRQTPMSDSLICTAMAPSMKLPAGPTHGASFTRSTSSTPRPPLPSTGKDRGSLPARRLAQMDGEVPPFPVTEERNRSCAPIRALALALTLSLLSEALKAVIRKTG
jgi:hypothetical protein